MTREGETANQAGQKSAATGELSLLISRTFEGDATARDELTRMVTGTQEFLDEASSVLKRMAVNDHTVPIKGSYTGVAKEVAESIGLVRDRLVHIAGSIEKISRGDLTELDEYRKVGRRSEQDRVVPGFIRTLENLQALTADASMLTKAAVEGRLGTRADATRHQGAYREIVDGVNKTLDSVIGPLNVAGDYVDKIGKGTIPGKITDLYQGDFNTLKNNINNCIDGLQGLVECNDVLKMMAVNDHTRRVEGSYVGIYASMAQATNDVRDRLLVVTKQINAIAVGDTSGLEALRKVGRRSSEDHLLPGIITSLETIENLIADTGMLVKAAGEGKLATRADASKHKGEYRKIVEGINQTLDSVMEPVNEALRVSKEFAGTNFTARVDPSLKVAGDWIAFKEALNNIGIGVSKAFSLINQQVIDLASSAEEANASIEEVASGSAQVAKNAAGVSSNAERGGENARQVMKAMEDLSVTVQSVATKTESVSKLALEANTLSKQGADLAKRADNGMTDITRNASEVATLVDEIKAQMDQIGKIVGLITDLANQTNLLALNAAIEAARAGDAGRGFAVVATEVKSLAQESRTSAEHIAEMIGALDQKTRTASEAMVEAGRTVKEGSAALSETLDSFNRIVKAIDDITRNVEEVASSSEEQAATVEEITASVTELTGAIQATAREAVDAAAASEESSAAVDQIGKIIGNVNVIVDNVSREMSRFKVG
jgi:methyl-accepting chemotaxis protein